MIAGVQYQVTDAECLSVAKHRHKARKGSAGAPAWLEQKALSLRLLERGSPNAGNPG